MDDNEKLLEILKQLKELASDDLRDFSHVHMLLNNFNEAATLSFNMKGYSIVLPLVHVEIIEMFNDFLAEAIEYLQHETE